MDDQLTELSTSIAKTVEAQSAAKISKILLNNRDAVFQQVRNTNFEYTASQLNQIAKRLQNDYESRHDAKTVQEMKSFVGRLTSLQSEHSNLKLR